MDLLTKNACTHTHVIVNKWKIKYFKNSAVPVSRGLTIPVGMELLIPKNNTASLVAEQVANLC